MARVKISELNAKTTAEDTDLLPIVDTTSEETKKAPEFSPEPPK